MSELNKGPKGPTVPGLIINDDLAANEMNQTDIFNEIPVDDVTLDNIDIDNQQSRRYQQQLKTMSVIKHIMNGLASTDCGPNTFQDGGDDLKSHEPVSGIHVRSEWKEAVASKEEKLLRAGCKVSKLVDLVLFCWVVNHCFRVSKLST